MALLPSTSGRRRELPKLPPDYDLTDIIILDWIAAEASRARRNHLPH